MDSRIDFDAEARQPLPGFRWSKLEIFNWGTFDGHVYTVEPRGQTTLLVGENGSGKSTLVDAMLTLLVRPQTRNYNVAAGATKNERDERTYIRGAYDRMVGEGGRPQVQYLRGGSGQYSILLATFANAITQATFTVCQVLYINHDNTVEKIYAFDERERSIVHDLGNLTSPTSAARELRDRGFRTTTSYKQYFGWLQKLAGFRPKAMDIFNQTVAVKDVQRLDVFIRQHMLERKTWSDRVARLLNHFAELSEAHRSLVRVREQNELLRPIVEAGGRYRERASELQSQRALFEATELYFADEAVRLLQPMCDKWQQQITYLSDEIKRLHKLQEKYLSDIAHLELEITHAGGDRLRQLPLLIEQAEQLAVVKAESRTRFESQLKLAGVQLQVTSAEQLQKARQLIFEQRRILQEERQSVRSSYDTLQYEIGDLTRKVQQDRKEVESLERQRGNLPESFIVLRNRMCQELRLPVSELPFAAELIAVAPQEKDWEASIEQVLYAFARSLLVPSEHYSRVAGYVEGTRLIDSRGYGQRLVYLRIGTKNEGVASEPHARSLVHKLLYREDHPLAAWVRAEICQRFDFVACETIEQFQHATGAAMTRNRHLKTGRSRHEKDDRTEPGDRRTFVLGWDNRAKRSALIAGIQHYELELEQIRQRANRLERTMEQAAASLNALELALQVEQFDAIDNLRHEFEASQLRIEKQRLEESSDTVRELRERIATLRAEADAYQAQRDDSIARRTTFENELRVGLRALEMATNDLRGAELIETLEPARRLYPQLREQVREALTIENLGTLPDRFKRILRERIEKLQEKLTPTAREVTGAMTRFLKKFPDEQADLDADVLSLESFEALYERIAKDDLPQHEERFKHRLNEKVLHEIGLLHGNLESDRQEIRDKIEQLNGALELLEWKPGTFMRLEPSDVQDREIQDFRRELANCLSGTLDGTPEANEATFVRIEKLVAKLRDESNVRWRDKVIDVRNWFNFAAREVVAATGESRSYYEGGTGQSGGEKGKLAFLVLVAAIAYQYNLEPDAETSDRFHFVMVDEMFSRSDDQHAEYALDLFERFGLQLLIVAPLDAKARVTEPYVGTYLHVVKNKETNRSALLSITAEELRESIEAS